MNEYEILAPAGSVEQLVAAVNNGCDSVYLGLDSFNARMKAPNFTAENICKWIDFCHFFGVKVYVTVNTSIKNCEFDKAVETVMTAYNNYVDGIIVTDLALLQFAAQLPKPFEVVASTQLNIHDKFGAMFVKSLGADTVVCSRECSCQQIKDIVSTGVKVECFLHGALCVCQSGQCLFSSMVGGNSGNRGLCAQPCRKFYKANDGKFVNGGYLLSAKDICGLDNAKRLSELGVTTFKIEGRNRRAEYAGATSQVYSQLFENNFTYDEGQKQVLKEMYNRGELDSCAYLNGKNDDIIYPFAQNHIGVVVGKIQNGVIVSQKPLSKGDGIKVFDGTKEVCGGTVLESGVGKVSAQFSGKVKDGMTVRRTTSKELCDSVLKVLRKRDVAMHLSAFSCEKAVLQLVSGDVKVQVKTSQDVDQARSKPTSVADFVEQLRKTGDLQYTITDIIVENDDVFMPKSQINALRREGLEELTKAIIDNYNKQFENRKGAQSHIFAQTKSSANKCLTVICKDIKQVETASKVADYVIFKPEFINAETLKGLSNCYVDLPSFADCDFLKSILTGNIGIVCHNVGQVQLARELGLHYIAGSGLNIFNDNMANMFSDADTFFYSQELTLDEIDKFSNRSGITFIDGKITLMKLVHCPFKVAYGCDCSTCKADKQLIYTDELGNNFEILRRRDSKCTFELINGKKLSVVNRLHRGGRYCVDFDDKIIQHYALLNDGKDDGYVELLPYTKGRLYSKIN